MHHDFAEIELSDEERGGATVLLNIKLRTSTGDIDFAGNRSAAQISRASARPLNEVYRQLNGRDHTEFVKAFGPSGAQDVDPSSRLRLDQESRRAFLDEVDSEIALHPKIELTYRRVLESISRKLR